MAIALLVIVVFLLGLVIGLTLECLPRREQPIDRAMFEIQLRMAAEHRAERLTHDIEQYQAELRRLRGED